MPWRAWALNYRVLSDPSTSPAEKAVAMCWVLHVAGDIRQPFNTTELFSAAYPDGDGGAGRQFVIDPLRVETTAGGDGRRLDGAPG